MTDRVRAPRRGPRRSRVLRALAAGFTATLLFAPPGNADTEPAPATLTQLAYDGSTLAGVLTLRATTGDLVVDPASLHVTVAGATTAATVEAATTMRRAVFLVVDTSGSMKANSGMPIIRAAVAEFLNRVPADVSVGVISFANVAGVDVDLTRDKAAIRTATDTLIAGGETALFDGVTLALEKLGATGERSIVVLSDGVNTAGRKDLAAVLNAVTQGGVRVDTIGLRTKVTADEVLIKLAAAGGGNFAPADDQAAVTGAFNASARALDRQVMWSVRPGVLPLGSTPVEVRGMASGTPFSATGTVTVSAVPTALPTLTLAPALPEASAAVAAPVETVAKWFLVLGIAGTFLGLLGLTAAAVMPTMRTKRENRIQNLEAYSARGLQITKPRRDTQSVITANLVDIGERVMAGRESTSQTMALLQRADLAWRPGEWAVLRLVGVIVGVIAGALVFRDGLVAVFGIVVGALAGLVLPSASLRLPPAANCTHLQDLAWWSLAHARRDTARCEYEIAVTDESEAPSECSVWRNGELAIRLQARLGTVVAPAAIVGKSMMRGFSAWATAHYPERDHEAAVMLQRGYFVAQAAEIFARIEREELGDRKSVV